MTSRGAASGGEAELGRPDRSDRNLLGYEKVLFIGLKRPWEASSCSLGMERGYGGVRSPDVHHQMSISTTRNVLGRAAAMPARVL